MNENWSQRISPPGLHDRTPRPERHATWLELFFDLVFVVAVAELGHLLAESLTTNGIIEFAALFVPVWWVWITHSYYGDIFDRDDTVYPLASIVVMLGVIVWSFTFHGAFHGGASGFVLVYLALRLLNTGLYLIAGRAVPETRRLATMIALGYLVGLAFWIGSFAVSPPMKYGLWVIGIVIEISSMSIVYVTLEDVPAQRSHMDERFGLFTIVVLGETILGVASGTSDSHWQATAVITGIAGFVIAVSLWWLYFAYSDNDIVNRFVRSDWRGVVRWSIYGYGHLPVFACITALGIGIEAAVIAVTDGHGLDGASTIVLFGSAAGFLVTVTGVQWAGLRDVPRSTIGSRMAGAGVVLLLAVASGYIGLLPATTLLAGLFVLLIAIEVPRIGGGVEGIERPV